MRNYSKDDLLKNFKQLDDRTVEEIAETVQFLSPDAKKRIAAQCERKMNMKDSKSKPHSTENQQTIDKVEIYRKSGKRFYPALAAAACVTLIAGVTVFIAALQEQDKNGIEKPYKNDPLQTISSSVSQGAGQSVTDTTTDTSVPSGTQAVQENVTGTPTETSTPEETAQPAVQVTENSEIASSSTQTLYIDETVIRKLFNENLNCFRHIFGNGSLSYSLENPPVKGDNIYEVISSEYPTFSDLERYVRSIYTYEVAHQLLYNSPYENDPKYMEIDGKLCINMNHDGARGYYVDWANCKIEILSVNDKTCSFRVTGALTEPGDDPQPEDYTRNGTAVYESDGWKLTSYMN